MNKKELLTAIIEIAKDTELQIKELDKNIGGAVKNDVIISLKAQSHELIVEQIRKYNRAKKEASRK